MGWICYPKTVRQRLNEFGLNVIVMQLNSSSFTQFKTRRPLNWVGRNCQLTAFSTLFLSFSPPSGSHLLQLWTSGRRYPSDSGRCFPHWYNPLRAFPSVRAGICVARDLNPLNKKRGEYAFKNDPKYFDWRKRVLLFEAEIILTGPPFCSGISVFVSISL